VEFGIILSLVIVPLILGMIDGTYLLLARYQMNNALRSVYAFAWANPSNATNQTDVNAILTQANSAVLASVTLAQTPSLTYSCLQADGSTTAASNGKCSSGTLQTIANYSLQSTVPLPFSFGVIATPYTERLSGSARVQ
jgi:Flp pilus assembly protein TadG